MAKFPELVHGDTPDSCRRQLSCQLPGTITDALHKGGCRHKRPRRKLPVLRLSTLTAILMKAGKLRKRCGENCNLESTVRRKRWEVVKLIVLCFISSKFSQITTILLLYLLICIVAKDQKPESKRNNKVVTRLKQR